VPHRSGAGRLAVYLQTLQLVANWRRSSIANTCGCRCIHLRFVGCLNKRIFIYYVYLLSRFVSVGEDLSPGSICPGEFYDDGVWPCATAVTLARLQTKRATWYITGWQTTNAAKPRRHNLALRYVMSLTGIRSMDFVYRDKATPVTVAVFDCHFTAYSRSMWILGLYLSKLWLQRSVSKS